MALRQRWITLSAVSGNCSAAVTLASPASVTLTLHSVQSSVFGRKVISQASFPMRQARRSNTALSISGASARPGSSRSFSAARSIACASVSTSAMMLL